MSESSSALDALTKVIVDTVKKVIGDANFDKSAQGVVKAVNGNTYTISVFGSTYDITTDQVYSVGQKVIVTALQGNMQRLVCSPDNIGTMHTINSQVKTVDDRLNDLESDYSDTVTKVDGITGQIDGQYQQWFYNEPPTLTNEPAKNWTTDDAKKSHIGDLYYDKTNDVAYQWTYKDGTYSWTVADNLIRVALAKAATAQDTADSKRRVFYNTPSPPYDKGDVWMQGDAGDILICKTAKTITQSYSASDWGVASKYTDDSAANKAQSTADSAKDTADKAYSSIVDLCIEGDTTKIDGSHIYTGTIDASAIKAGTIKADQIAAGTITADNILLNSVTFNRLANDATTKLIWQYGGTIDENTSVSSLTVSSSSYPDLTSASAVLIVAQDTNWWTGSVTGGCCAYIPKGCGVTMIGIKKGVVNYYVSYRAASFQSNGNVVFGGGYGGDFKGSTTVAANDHSSHDTVLIPYRIYAVNWR